MKCPICGSNDLSVIDSRACNGGQSIRRRRVCGCGKRFTTYESIVDPNLISRTQFADSVGKAIMLMVDLLPKDAVEEMEERGALVPESELCRSGAD